MTIRTQVERYMISIRCADFHIGMDNLLGAHEHQVKAQYIHQELEKEAEFIYYGD